MSLDTDTREPNSGVYGDVLSKISVIFGAHLNDVIKAYRRLETLTNYTNVTGKQNLLEAFSHLALLFEKAPTLNRDEQLEQVAHTADHLRRVLMEGAEQDVYVALTDVWVEGVPDNIGQRYERHAAPLIVRGKLSGLITPDEVRRRQYEILDRVSSGRGAKVVGGEWELWKDASVAFDQAARELRELKQEMGLAVGAADEISRTRRLWASGIALGAVAAVVLEYLVRHL